MNPLVPFSGIPPNIGIDWMTGGFSVTCVPAIANCMTGSAGLALFAKNKYKKTKLEEAKRK